MSVQALDPKEFVYIRSCIKQSAWHTTVDIWYNYVISSHFQNMDIEKEAERLINSLALMNYKSYAGRYRENKVTDITPFILGNEIKTDVYQYLKLVKNLIYNIEPEHWQLSEQEKEDFELLKQINVGIMSAIISSLPEYKKALWSLN